MLTEAKLDSLLRYVAMNLSDDEFKFSITRAARYRLTLRELVKVIAERTAHEREQPC